jgi:hypothetical protein
MLLRACERVGRRERRLIGIRAVGYPRSGRRARLAGYALNAFEEIEP